MYGQVLCLAALAGDSAVLCQVNAGSSLFIAVIHKDVGLDDLPNSSGMFP